MNQEFIGKKEDCFLCIALAKRIKAKEKARPE